MLVLVVAKCVVRKDFKTFDIFVVFEAFAKGNKSFLLITKSGYEYVAQPYGNILITQVSGCIEDLFVSNTGNHLML